MTVWEEIKSKLSIEEVIVDYVPVKNKGINFTCICPFHREKTPSLVISTEKQIWHCFGCGAGGDCFTFVEMIENINQQESLQKLAKKAGVKLENDFSKADNKALNASPEQQSKTEQGSSILAWTADLYHNILIKLVQGNDNPIKAYCVERGLSLDIIKKFKLGYAPKNHIITSLIPNQKQENIDLFFELGLLRLPNE